MVEPPIKKSDKAKAEESSTSPKATEASQAARGVTVKPVKKSERPTVESNVDDDNSSSEERRMPQRDRGRDRDRDKGRGKGRGEAKGNRNSEARPSNINPALMRGPKPTKPKPPVIAEETPVEMTEDSEVETEQVTTTEE
jgi:hypothetical protein